MQKRDGKSQSNVLGNYKLDRFTLLNNTSSNTSIFRNKISAATASGIYKKEISLPLNSSSEPKFNSGTIWWVNNLEIWNGKSILSPINKTIIQTDASQKGWGAYCQKISIGGQWTLQESRLHINLLQIKAINLTLLTFHKMFSLKSAHFQVDKTAVLSYLMKMGGTGSREMTALAKEIWEFALPQKIIITAEYLPEKLNVRADWASRNFQDFSEWLLSPKVFQMISRNWGTLEIYLFVSRACHQRHTYMVWRPDPHSQATYALQQKWENLGLLCAFLPFSLIGRVPLRVREEGLTMILVTPSWPAQPWYSHTLDLA